MPSDKNERKGKLRVVEEETVSEEILRLGRDKVEEVARIRVEPPVEAPTRLVTEEAEFERRSHEPDIDVIIEDARDSEELEDHWQGGAKKGPVPYGWFVLIFIGLVGSVGWSLGWFGEDEGGQVVEMARQESVDRLEEEDLEIQEATALVERVEAHVRKYCEAETIEELLPLVRSPKRVESLMREWYAASPLQAHRFERIVLFQPLDLDARNFYVVTYEYDGSDRGKTVLVEDRGEGGLLVDWETDVCYQPMNWDDYVKQRPEGVKTFRVRMELDYAGLYSHEFQDEEKWEGFRLTAHRSDEFLVGYVKRRSEMAESLRALIEDNGYRPVAVILTLRVPQDVESYRGVVIEEVVSKRWLLQEAE